MLKSSGAMAAATMTSRLLGMVREMVYASFMGTGWVASAFTLAFQVPNLFRRLLGEGALTAAFIPIFKQKQVREGEAEMWRSSNAVISGLVSAAAAVTVLAIVGISIALRFHEFNQETELMLQLLRFMFPYMLLVCLAAVLIGMANARGHFFVPALGAAILNVVMIASVIFLAPSFGPKLERRVFALVSDAECNEGVIWEAAMFDFKAGRQRTRTTLHLRALRETTFLMPGECWRCALWQGH